MAAYTTIDDSSAFFKVQLYTGNGSDNHAITFDDSDTDMAPNLVWIKNRDSTDVNCIFDSNRGATEFLYTGEISGGRAEIDDDDTLDSFTSDGFQVDDDDRVNTNAEKYVSWNWKGGTTSGIDATGADITPSSYSFSQDAGISILLYTGNGSADQKVAHGLGAIPDLMLVKSVSSNDDWISFHKDMHADDPEDYTMSIGDTSARYNASYAWNDTMPTSVFYTVNNSDAGNKSGGEMVGYCFKGKQGFSKFGGYTGNGDADGVFIYLGFRPAYLTIWNADSAGSNKYVFDYKRAGYNIQNNRLDANTSASQGTDVRLDFLSNGFKVRNTGNPNTATLWIYAAFAEAPFVNSNGVPGCAK